LRRDTKKGSKEKIETDREIEYSIFTAEKYEFFCGEKTSKNRTLGKYFVEFAKK
jgi:hypothetical protein